MQSSSTVSGVPLPENIRPGQEEVIRAAAKEETLLVAKLPTGYGKTQAFCLSFAVKRALGVTDNLLYLVPRDVQVEQAAEEVPRLLKELADIDTTAVVIRTDPIIALKRLKNGKAIVFVASIQSLATSNSVQTALSEMLHIGKWFFAVDEYHNLPLMVGENPGRYWSALEQLPRAFTLAMSATPPQNRGKDPFPPPSVVVRYAKAAPQYVKKMRLHAYEYRVDGVTVNGDVISFSTTEFEENQEEIERQILSGQMRWSPKYVSPLILIPVERMIDYRNRGIRTQMIVRCISCSHAELICSQIRALLPTLQVDWVGTGPNGRSQAENKAIIKRFCPPKKNGRRKWDLDVLVQRGVAAEGLDTVDVSELVHLCQFNGTATDLQFDGRGSRVMYDANGNALDVWATVNVDTATRIGRDEQYHGKKFMDLFDAELPPIDDDDDFDEDEGEGDYDPDDVFLQEDRRPILADVSLIDVKTEPGYQEMFDALRTDAGAKHKTDEELHSIAEDVMRKHIAERDKSLNASSVRAQWKNQISNAVSKLVSRLMRRMANTGIRVEKTMAGDITKRIRSMAKRKFGELDSLDVEELESQYKWLVKVEQDIALDRKEELSWLL